MSHIEPFHQSLPLVLNIATLAVLADVDVPPEQAVLTFPPELPALIEPGQSRSEPRLARRAARVTCRPVRAVGEGSSRLEVGQVMLGGLDKQMG